MKYTHILLSLITITFMVSCASKPISSRAIEIAKPKQVKAPDAEVIETKVANVKKTAHIITNDVISAKKNIKELEKRVEDAEDINSDFEDAIKELAVENKAKMIKFNERFTALYTRTSDTIKNLKLNLDDAISKLSHMDKQLDEANAEIQKHKATIVASVEEKIKLRELVNTLQEARVLDETYRVKAEAREKYVWMFYGLLCLVAVSIFLQMRFKLL